MQLQKLWGWPGVVVSCVDGFGSTIAILVIVCIFDGRGHYFTIAIFLFFGVCRISFDVCCSLFVVPCSLSVVGRGHCLLFVVCCSVLC